MRKGLTGIDRAGHRAHCHHRDFPHGAARWTQSSLRQHWRSSQRARTPQRLHRRISPAALTRRCSQLCVNCPASRKISGKRRAYGFGGARRSIVLPRKDGTGEVNVTVRGMMPDGLEMRPGVKLVQGRWFTPGQREVVVSDSIQKRFSHAMSATPSSSAKVRGPSSAYSTPAATLTNLKFGAT